MLVSLPWRSARCLVAGAAALQHRCQMVLLHGGETIVLWQDMVSGSEKL